MSITTISPEIYPTYRRLTITPDMAARILTRNENNRSYDPNSRHAQMLRRALTRGEWVFNGDAIRIDEHGNLIDGQHRLNAVIQTGIPIDTLLVEGLPARTQTTMDTGRRRNTRDYLVMRGEKNVVVLSALISAAIARDTYGVDKGLAGGGFNKASIEEELAYLDTHPHLRDVATETTRLVSLGIKLAPSFIAYFVDTFRAVSREDADYFMQRLADGVGLQEGNPILTLRAALRKNNESKRNRANKRYLGALTIKAWNKYMAGEQCFALSFRVGGAQPEKFPEVAGVLQ